MRGFGFDISHSPEDVAQTGAGDPHPAVPAGFSRGEKDRANRIMRGIRAFEPERRIPSLPTLAGGVEFHRGSQQSSGRGAGSLVRHPFPRME
jgi:hypothetical protein